MSEDPAEYLVEGKYGIEDLVDASVLERVFEKFSAATGFTTGFLAYPSQKILVKTGWRDACVKFHRACPESAVHCKESNVDLSGHLKKYKELRVRRCGMGLVDGATPIIVRGKYLAYLATGQVFFEAPDMDRYRQFSRTYGYDEDAYLEAIRQVPVVDENRFRAVLSFLSEIAVMIAELGLANLQGRERAVELEADIRRRIQAEEERRALEARLHHTQKLESLGVLAGGIAHDFNNLLLAILGNLDLALMDLQPESPVKPSIDDAIHAARRAEDLTRQMLAYSGKGKFILSHLSLSDLVEENAQLLRACMAKTTTFQLHLKRGVPCVDADVGQIQQVVMNLITNASEAIGDGPGTVDLFTGVMECDAEYLSHSRLAERVSPGRYVYLEVKDSGCGMDARTQHCLFDPFFTTKATGRGLGMSAVSGVMHGHKGALMLESIVGKGTTVRVLFPAAKELSPALETPEVVSAAAETGGRVMKGTILVVDDEDIIRDVCAQMIERFGLSVLTATDGRDAIEVFCAHETEITCVVMDLSMPRMDGLTAFHELHKLSPGLIVLLSSGYNEQDASKRFNTEGLDGFIQKPYRMATLKAALQQAFAGRRG